MFRKVPVLPLTFPGDVCGFGGGDSVGSGVRGVTGNMDGCGRMTGGTCGGTSRSMIGVARSGVGGKCGSAGLAHCYLVTHPRPPCFNSLPRPVILGVFFLEVWEYMLGTVGCPKHQ
jgi:hypothetical protein